MYSWLDYSSFLRIAKPVLVSTSENHIHLLYFSLRFGRMGKSSVELAKISCNYIILHFVADICHLNNKKMQLVDVKTVSRSFKSHDFIGSSRTFGSQRTVLTAKPVSKIHSLHGLSK